MALKRPLRAAAVAALLALSAWIAAGIRVIDPDDAVRRRREATRSGSATRACRAPARSGASGRVPRHALSGPAGGASASGREDRVPPERRWEPLRPEGDRHGGRAPDRGARLWPHRRTGVVSPASCSGRSARLPSVFSDADREDRGISTRTNAFERAPRRGAGRARGLARYRSISPGSTISPPRPPRGRSRPTSKSWSSGSTARTGRSRIR